MIKIDIISAVGMAYQKTWMEKRYLLPMFIVPFLINFFCYTIAQNMAEEGGYLRFALVMIPGYFAEGWLLSHWVRTIVLGHRWPFRLSGDDEEDIKQLKRRGRGVLSGTVCYTLIKLLIGGYGAYYISLLPEDLNPENADPQFALIGLIMLGVAIALFRYIWFFIPLSVNTAPQLYLSAIGKFSSTLPMLSVWLICVIPPLLILQILHGVFLGTEGDMTVMSTSVMSFFHILIEMIKNLIVVAGLTIVIMQLLGLKKRKD